jgi:hypothetical protein
MLIKNWGVYEDRDAVHVIPENDLIVHDHDDSCVCGPFSEMVAGPGGDGWLVVHEALDGRA